MSEKELQELISKAESGDAEAQYELGLLYRNQAEERLSILKENVPSGSPTMRWPYSIGERNYFGRITSEEFEKAFFWFEKSAAQGNLDALYNLSICYEHGEGTAPFPEKAQELLMGAAEKGYAAAECDIGMQFYLGKTVIKGVEIKKDYQKAVCWLQRAAEHGSGQAQYYLAICYEEGTGIAQDEEMAQRWFRAAEESGFYVFE